MCTFRVPASACALALAVLALTPSTGAQEPLAPGEVTFVEHIQPLLNAKCAACHHEGGPAPFTVDTYEDAAPYARAMWLAAAEGYMPPWKPEPGFGGPFVGERRLTNDEIELLRRWAFGGTPRGEAAAPDAMADMDHLGHGVDAAGGWQLGTPDLVVELPEAYVLQPGGRDVFRNFALPIPVDGPRVVKGVEFQPTNHRVSHHANIRIDPTVNSLRLEARDPAVGYDAIASPTAVFPDGHFLGWTPGQLAPFLPDGMGWRLGPDTTLAVEMHLVPGTAPEPVGFRVGLYFTDVQPTVRPVMLRLGEQGIDIPAGEADYRIRDSYRLPVDVEVLSVQPHAHYRANEVKGWAELPDGSREWLIAIERWDFHVQDLYRLVEPLPLPAGTTVHMEYSYDNSADNPRNPVQPPVRVRWGQYTNDEMGDLHLQLLTRDPADTERLLAGALRKQLEDDMVGYEVLLETVPDNPMIHANFAVTLDALGRDPARAVEHYRAYAALDGSPVAHYSLATALAARGATDEALVAFRRAIALGPDDAFAHFVHNGLGGLLLALGDAEAALAEFTAAAAIEPNYGFAYNNMGVALERLGRPRDALLAYLKAAEVDATIADARFNAGWLLEGYARHVEALPLYREAHALAPDDVDTGLALAWLLATSSAPEVRNPAEALRLAEALADDVGDDPRVLDVLAAAQAATGDFDRAEQTARDAARRLSRQGDRERAAAAAHRADFYERSVPYVLPAESD